MFELGARPHPPRKLYRAYLEQSDVFVGVYWQEYGWIAPDEDVSGLEDEYRLAPRDMPKLIYVKQPAEREPRLAELMSRIREDDTASYTPFSTADELSELVAADLATLLAERFDASRAAPEPAHRHDARRAHSGTLFERRRPRARSRDAARVARRGRPTTRHARGPGRDRQEPPRDRGRPQRRRTLRPGDVRVAGAGARPRRGAGRDRAGARGPRHGRCAAERAAGDRARRPTRPHRARQLRADRRRRPRRRLAPHRPARRDLPRDQPRPAAGARRTGLRCRTTRPAAGALAGVDPGHPRGAGRAAVPRSRAVRGLQVRRDR